MRGSGFAAVIVVLSLAWAALPPLAAQEATFNLTVLHTNDTHAHHEPQGRSGARGIARQAAVVKAIRAAVPNTVLVDAGDRFTGTLYHKYYQGDDNVRAMNALGYDAMALGNHEFDNGLEVLANFVAAAEFPVLAANVDFTGGDELAGPLAGRLAGRVSPSAILDVGGERVAFIGLVTAETPQITINFAGKDRLRWRDDYAAVVNAEVERLEDQGINKILLLTHIGLGVDLELAARTRGVDAVVGGHSHTAVSSIYKEAGAYSYPLQVANADGEPVYVVQAGDRTRYLGQLNLRFDADGKVTRARGDLILLSAYVTPDPDVQALLSELAEPINVLKNTPLEDTPGQPVVNQRLLSNRDCRAGECALGSLIADAMRAEAGTQIAVQNGGGIRADIDEGEVTVGEVLTVLPFGNTLATLKLTGANLMTALESGLSRVGAASGSGRFPQVSGLRYRFDPSRPPGSRLTQVDLVTADGAEPLDPQRQYSIATNNFMRTGGDGYTVFNDSAVDPYDFGRPLEEALIDYMIANRPLDRQPDGRIQTAR